METTKKSKVIFLRLYPERSTIDKELFEMWQAIKQLAREQGMTSKRVLYELLSDKKHLLREVQDVKTNEKTNER
jgi:hypothetical protein